MTRQEIEKQYKVENGIIRSPGKFEGELVCAPAMYDIWMLVDGGEKSSMIEVDYDIIAEYPEIADWDYVYITEDEQGFVHIEEYTLDDVAEEATSPAGWRSPVDMEE